MFVAEKLNLSLFFSAEGGRSGSQPALNAFKKLYRRIANKAAPTPVVCHDSALVCAPAWGWCH
jgi:hypothetical protein